MIRFCDKEVYRIVEGEMTKYQIMQLFLQREDNRHLIIAVYGEGSKLKGIIAYEDLLKHEKPEDCINTGIIAITEDFWEKAKEYFARKYKDLLTVVDKNGDILGFAYNDNTDYAEMEIALTALENGDFIMPQQFQRVQMVVIVNLNELAWRCYNIFMKKGFCICVAGKEWDWFGIKSGKDCLNYQDYTKMYLYAEGTGIIKGEGYRLGGKCFESVMSSFNDMYNIAIENERYVYAKVMERLLENGVAVCECYLPLVNEIEVKTDEELQCMRLGVSFINYLKKEEDFSEEMKECLWSIYGREKSITIKEKGNKNRVKNIPLGTIGGYTLKEGRNKGRIYLLGPCIVDGNGCLEEDSLSGHLQTIADRFSYQVVSVPIPICRFDIWQALMDNLPVTRRDIILVINVNYWFPGGKRNCGYLDLKSVYEKKDRRTMFCEVPIHTNWEGNHAIAEEIARQYLIEKMKELVLRETIEYVQEGELLNPEGIHAIREYTDLIRVDGIGTAGAIVMNCNPFTYGHRYLIEYASRKVDKLYVFVVEEDKSFFKFKDRFEMVKQGTQDIPNVFVAPSGRWVLSYKTMPAYFEKETVQEIKIDAQYDLEIFARYVARQLGISIRFVGEEPIDRITCQYNEQMREILPLFGIELVEIPRLKFEGEVISASTVRNYLTEGKVSKLKKLVPESTYIIMRNYYGRDIYEDVV